MLIRFGLDRRSINRFFLARCCHGCSWIADLLARYALCFLTQMTDKIGKEQNKSNEPMSFAEGIGRLLAMIMLLLRALAIGVICYFLYRFIEPLLH